MSERTNMAYNLNIFKSLNFTGLYDMPKLNKTNADVESIIPFNMIRTTKPSNSYVHFFLDDYQFERCWSEPSKNVAQLRKWGGVLSPDFSLYLDMPTAMKVWNIYRSRLLGAYWQSQGITVIPTVSWAEEESYNYCFDGLPMNSTLAVSSVGIKQNKEACRVWKNGMDEMITRLQPRKILLYGPEMGYTIDSNIKVVHFENAQIKRLRRLK